METALGIAFLVVGVLAGLLMLGLMVVLVRVVWLERAMFGRAIKNLRKDLRW